MTSAIRILMGLGISAALVACGASTGASNPDGGTGAGGGGAADAGMWTTHPIKGQAFCRCPGETAAQLQSAPAGATGVEWLRTFTPTLLASGDQLIFDIDFAGPATWQLGLADMQGHIGFPATGGPPLDPANWNCVHVVYSLQNNSYEVYVNSASHTGMAPTFMATTVMGVDVKFSGSSASQAWIDSVVVIHLTKDGTSTTLLSESFDDPASAGNGLAAGDGVVATPPATIKTPGYCAAL